MFSKHHVFVKIGHQLSYHFYVCYIFATKNLNRLISWLKV
jgi:hypothetical protein